LTTIFLEKIGQMLYLRGLTNRFIEPHAPRGRMRLGYVARKKIAINIQFCSRTILAFSEQKKFSRRLLFSGFSPEGHRNFSPKSTSVLRESF